MRKYTIILTVFGIGLLMVLLFTTDFNDVVQTLRHLKPIHLVGLIALQFLTIALLSLQWKVLSYHLGMRLTYGTIFEMNMVSKFYESITPALKTGGEAAKLYYLKTKGQSIKNGATLIMVQKFISMSVFIGVFLSVIMLSFLRGFSIDNAQIFFLTIGIFVLILGISFCVLTIYVKKNKNNAQSFAYNISTSLKHAATYKLSFFIHLLIAAFIWSLYGFKTFYVIHSLGYDLSYLFASLSTLSAYLVSMVPITPGGLGTFETTFVTMLPQFGIVSGAALVIVLTLRVATYWFQLAFSGLFLLSKHILKRWNRYATE